MLPSNLPGVLPPSTLLALRHASVSSPLLITAAAFPSKVPSRFRTNRRPQTPQSRSFHWPNRRTETWLSSLDSGFEQYALRRMRSMRYRLIQALRRKSSWERDGSEWARRMQKKLSTGGPYTGWMSGFCCGRVDQKATDKEGSSRREYGKFDEEAERDDGHQLSDREIQWRRRMKEMREALDKDPYRVLFGRDHFVSWPRDVFGGDFAKWWREEVETLKQSMKQFEEPVRAAGEKKESATQSGKAKLNDGPDKGGAETTGKPAMRATSRSEMQYDPITMRMVPKATIEQMKTQEERRTQEQTPPKAMNEAVDIPVKKFIEPLVHTSSTMQNNTVSAPQTNKPEPTRPRDPVAATLEEDDRRSTAEGKAGPRRGPDPEKTAEEYDRSEATSNPANASANTDPVAAGVKGHNCQSNEGAQPLADPITADIKDHDAAASSKSELAKVISSGSTRISSRQESEQESALKGAELSRSVPGDKQARPEHVKPETWLSREGFRPLAGHDEASPVSRQADRGPKMNGDKFKPPVWFDEPSISLRRKPIGAQYSPKVMQKQSSPADDVENLRACDIRARMGRRRIRKSLEKPSPARSPGIVVSREPLIQQKRIADYLRERLVLRQKNAENAERMESELQALESARGLERFRLWIKIAERMESELLALESARGLERFRLWIKIPAYKGVERRLALVERSVKRSRLGIKSPAEKQSERRVALVEAKPVVADNTLQDQDKSFRLELERKRLRVESPLTLAAEQSEAGLVGSSETKARRLETSLQRELVENLQEKPHLEQSGVQYGTSQPLKTALQRGAIPPAPARELDLVEAQHGRLRVLREVAARKRLDEEIKAQKAAMQALEDRRMDAPVDSRTTVRELSEKSGESDVSPTVAHFNNSHHPSEQNGPNIIARGLAKQEQKERDRELYREVRNIYEDAYGVIDTKHRQGELQGYGGANVRNLPEGKQPYSFNSGPGVSSSSHINIHSQFPPASSAEHPPSRPSATGTTPLSVTQGASPDSQTTALSPSEPSFSFEITDLSVPGYEIVHNDGDLIILKKIFSSKRALTSTEREGRRSINPIDGTTIGNFASPTGFVNHDALGLPPVHSSPDAPPHPSSDSSSLPAPNSAPAAAASAAEPSASGGPPVRRQEPVFSGQRRKWHHRYQNRREKKRKGRVMRALRRVLFLGVWTAGCCYAVGVVAEYFRTGGSTGLGPQGF